MKQPSRTAKAPKTVEPTLSDHLWIDAGGSRTAVATVEVYCFWLTEEDKTKIAAEIRRILQQLKDAAVNVFWKS